MKANCLWWSVLTKKPRHQEKEFAKSIAAYQVSPVVLICASNETASQRAAAIGISAKKKKKKKKKKTNVKK
jgi:hypothetical protein